LISAKMGARFYVSGTEGFIGQAMQVAIENGIDFNSIRTEHRGSMARRVQCVHCKGVTDNVTTLLPLRPDTSGARSLFEAHCGVSRCLH
jgi:dimethylamine monooxygenase subunit C